MKMKIGDISTYIKRGITPKYVVENGYAVVNQKCIRDGKVNYEYIKYTDIHKKYNEEKKVNQGDILINSTGTGTLGRVAYVDKDASYTYVDSHVTILRCENYNSKFLYYWLSSLEKYIESLGKGSTNQIELNKDAIEEIEIPKLDLEQQNIVVENLSTYDDLIENNERQIKLLEEAAQRLYKEWFVDLHFPGYEDVEIVDGVPDGWRKASLTEIAPIVTGKKDANFATENGKYLFFTCAQEPIKAASYSFDCDAVILAGNGDFNVKLYRGQFEAYQRTYVFSPYDSSNLYLLYYAVKNNMRQLFQGASGSTIKFLTKRMLEEIMIYIPDEIILEAFTKYCESYQKKIEILKKQITFSTEARDRLLPKLMSGEIQV